MPSPPPAAPSWSRFSSSAPSWATRFPGGVRISPQHGRIQRPQITLTANVNFSITSRRWPAPVLYRHCTSAPGRSRVSLLHRGQSLHTVDHRHIDERQLDHLFAVDCPTSNLDMSSTAYSGMPALVVAPHGAGTVGEPISMVTSSTNQDACLGTTFNFANVGKAHFTTTPPTSTSPTTTPTAGPSPPTPTAGSSNANPAWRVLHLDVTVHLDLGLYRSGHRFNDRGRVLAIAVGLLIMATAGGDAAERLTQRTSTNRHEDSIVD